VPSGWTIFSIPGPTRMALTGDILLGDRGFGSFPTVAHLPRQGVDAVARLHQRRKVDFRKAKRSGTHDGLFVWRKGYPQSNILTAAQWRALPEAITVRIVRFHATIRVFATARSPWEPRCWIRWPIRPSNWPRFAAGAGAWNFACAM
jgi:hypothetical protein